MLFNFVQKTIAKGMGCILKQRMSKKSKTQDFQARVPSKIGVARSATIQISATIFHFIHLNHHSMIYVAILVLAAFVFGRIESARIVRA